MIFRDETDRADFVTRLAPVAEAESPGGSSRRLAPAPGVALQPVY